MNGGPNSLRILGAGVWLLVGCGPVASAQAPDDAAATGPVLAVAAPQPSARMVAPQRAPAPPAAPPAPPAPPAAATAPTTPDLGPLPAELSALAWPARPRTNREVTVTSFDALVAAVAVPGTFVRARGVTGGDLSIAAHDVEIDADTATSLGVLTVQKSTQRVRVTGGRWAGVRVAIPAEFNPTRYDAAWLAQDLHFENMTVAAGDETAFEIRGRRIAIVGAEVTAGRYAVWLGDTGDFQSEDLILFDNVFRSAGPESTVRLVQLLRSAVVGNVMTNTRKHNYRIHGRSDLNFAGDNLLVGTGVMLGTMAGDALGHVWFDDNALHHRAEDLFNPSRSALRTLVARRNRVYADGRANFVEGEIPGAWVLSENTVEAYAPPPPF